MSADPHTLPPLSGPAPLGALHGRTDPVGAGGEAGIACRPSREEPAQAGKAHEKEGLAPSVLLVAASQEWAGVGAVDPSSDPAKIAATVPSLPALSILHEDEYELLRRIEKLETDVSNLEGVLRMAVQVATKASEDAKQAGYAVDAADAVIQRLAARPLVCDCCRQLDAIAERGAA